MNDDSSAGAICLTRGWLRRILCGGMIAFTVASTPAAWAQETTSIGAGARMNCSGWMDARRTNVLEHSLTNWALGYVSGAAQHGQVGDPLEQFDIHGVKRWLDIYCTANSARDFAGALDAFIAERLSE